MTDNILGAELEFTLDGTIVVVPTAESPVSSVNGRVGAVRLQPDEGANLVDTVTPTSYYRNCRAIGSRLSLDILESVPDATDDDTRFRINLTEPLKANTTYTLSFRASGCGDAAPAFYLMYATADSSSTPLGSRFALSAGKVTFTTGAAGVMKRILMTNSGVTGRTAQTGIVLTDFKLESGGTATAFVPSGTALNRAAQLERWRQVQSRIFQEAVNRFPLYFADNVTGPNLAAGKTLSEYNDDYRPAAVYSWARKELSVVANFKALCEITDGMTILTGLPPVFRPVALYNALSWIEDGQLCSAHAVYTTERFTSVPGANSRPASPGEGDVIYLENTGRYETYLNGAWQLRYTPCGVLKFCTVKLNGESVEADASIPSGSQVRFDSRPIPLATPYGAHRFPWISETDIANAGAWLVSHRGRYHYTNNGRWRRKSADDIGVQPAVAVPSATGLAYGLGATDCSGIIHQAFRYGAGKFVPDGSKSQVGFGRIVAFARRGERLDLSELRAGDIVGYIGVVTGSAKEKLWSVIHVAMAVEVDGEVRLWHVSSEYGTEYADDYGHKKIVGADGRPRSTVSTDDATFGPQPVAGTYSGGSTYTDETYSSWNARIVVRWTEDCAALDSDLA